MRASTASGSRSPLTRTVNGPSVHRALRGGRTWPSKRRAAPSRSSWSSKAVATRTVLLAGVVAVEPDVVAALSGRPRRAGLGLDLVAHLEAGGGDRRLHVGRRPAEVGAAQPAAASAAVPAAPRRPPPSRAAGRDDQGHQQAPEHGDVEEALDPRVEDAHVR